VAHNAHHERAHHNYGFYFLFLGPPDGTLDPDYEAHYREKVAAQVPGFYRAAPAARLVVGGVGLDVTTTSSTRSARSSVTKMKSQAKAGPGHCVFVVHASVGGLRTAGVAQLQASRTRGRPRRLAPACARAWDRLARKLKSAVRIAEAGPRQRLNWPPSFPAAAPRRAGSSPASAATPHLHRPNAMARAGLRACDFIFVTEDRDRVEDVSSTSRPDASDPPAGAAGAARLEARHPGPRPPR